MNLISFTEYELKVFGSVFLITTIALSIIRLYWNEKNKPNKKEVMKSDKEYNDKNKP